MLPPSQDESVTFLTNFNFKIFMSTLVTLLTSGKGTWSEVANIMRIENWNKIIIITNQFGSETFQKKENMHFIIINENDTAKQIQEQLVPEFKEHIHDIETALNMSSGTGKEHMAVLSALLKSGVGIRVITHNTADNSILEL